MKTRVTEEGVLVPKEMLEGMDEVEIYRQDSMIVIVPAHDEDPILELGKHPVRDDITDASEKLDSYLYGSL